MNNSPKLTTQSQSRVDLTVGDGAETSFDEFFRREFAQVVRFAYAMTRSNAEAQDATQEAFARLFQQWASVANPAGFVRTVVVNQIRDHSRHLQVRRRFLSRADKSEPALSETDYLADALSGLSKQRRAIVVLRFYERMTVDEIAQILNVPAGTVKSGLSRSMRQLREVLK